MGGRGPARRRKPRGRRAGGGRRRRRGPAYAARRPGRVPIAQRGQLRRTQASRSRRPPRSPAPPRPASHDPARGWGRRVFPGIAPFNSAREAPPPPSQRLRNASKCPTFRKYPAESARAFSGRGTLTRGPGRRALLPPFDLGSRSEPRPRRRPPPRPNLDADGDPVPRAETGRGSSGPRRPLSCSSPGVLSCVVRPAREATRCAPPRASRAVPAAACGVRVCWAGRPCFPAPPPRGPRCQRCKVGLLPVSSCSESPACECSETRPGNRRPPPVSPGAWWP